MCIYCTKQCVVLCKTCVEVFYGAHAECRRLIPTKPNESNLGNFATFSSCSFRPTFQLSLPHLFHHNRVNSPTIRSHRRHFTKATNRNIVDAWRFKCSQQNRFARSMEGKPRQENPSQHLGRTRVLRGLIGLGICKRGGPERK